MISVVIPAHNEQAVIDRGLHALLDGAEAGELEIIVACNGCTDATANKAREFAPPVQVIEIDRASKTAALNAADRLATAFPRLYVDADVVLPLSSARKVAAELERSAHLLASPVARTDTSASSPTVRAFYDVWLRLPYNRVMVGTGVYGLSKEGRGRFGEFPDIIADDGFVRSRFGLAERAAVAGALVTVVAPRTLGDLIRVKTRSRLGRYELSKRYPEEPGAGDPRHAPSIVSSLPWDPALPWRLTVYLWVNVLVRIRARCRFHTGVVTSWDRDEAARV